MKAKELWHKAMSSWRSKREREKLAKCWSKSFRDVAHTPSLPCWGDQVGQMPVRDGLSGVHLSFRQNYGLDDLLRLPSDQWGISLQTQQHQSLSLQWPSWPLNLSGWCSGAAAPTAASQNCFSSFCRAKHWQSEILLGPVHLLLQLASASYPVRQRVLKHFKQQAFQLAGKTFIPHLVRKKKQCTFRVQKVVSLRAAWREWGLREGLLHLQVPGTAPRPSVQKPVGRRDLYIQCINFFFFSSASGHLHFSKSCHHTN